EPSLDLKVFAKELHVRDEVRSRVHAHVGRRIARVRRAPSTPALVELHDEVALRIEIPAVSGAATGAGSAVNDERRLPVRIAARLPVDAVVITNLQQTMVERLDERIRLHASEVTRRF